MVKLNYGARRKKLAGLLVFAGRLLASVAEIVYHGPLAEGKFVAMLLFKKKFIELIRSGKKTQTIRLWNYRRMKPGQRSYVPGVGYISILSVDPIELTSLTDEDAILDGFPTAELLRDEIEKLYSAETLQKMLPFRIRFSVYPPKEQLRMRKEKQKQNKLKKQTQNKDAVIQESIAKKLKKLLRMCKTTASK